MRPGAWRELADAQSAGSGTRHVGYSHPMPFGASLSAGGGVDFHLWAPAAKQAAVSYANVQGDTPRIAPALMATIGTTGWWHCHLPDAGPGTAYQWQIDGELLVPDPASRSNPQGPHAPCVVTDPLAFDWTPEEASWVGRPWAETVLYEMHVGAFTPEGTLDAAIRQLPRLAQLGITAVELMPVASFPGRFGWGYDGVLPFSPFAPYGPPDALKRFVRAAHSLGLMVFMDVVYNHFGPDGNYLSRYAPTFFSLTRSSPWGAAINFDGAGSDAVREFFIHNALYWVQEFRIDGLRLDAVHAIHDSREPDFLEEMSARVRAATGGRHVHLVLENENNHNHRLCDRPKPGQFDAQWNDDFHHAMHVLLTGETRGYYVDYGHDPLALLARSLTHGFVFAGSPRLDGGARVSVAAAPAQPLPAMVNYCNNHDQTGNRAFGERMGELAPPGAAEIAMLVALLTPATPMLFFGEEFGAQTPFLYFADWQGELRDAVIAGRKREFGHMLAGLPPDADGHPRELPGPCDESTFEAVKMNGSQARSAQANAWQALIAHALSVRRESIVPRQHLLAHGQHSATLAGASGLQVRWRYTDGAELWMDANLGPAPIAAADIPEAMRVEPVDATLLMSHHWSERPDGGWPSWMARWRFVPAFNPGKPA